MTLRDFFALIGRNALFFIVIPLICGIAGAVFSWGFLPDQYSASTSVYALAKSANQNQSSVSSSDLSASQMIANDFTQLVNNEQIRNKTAEAVGMSSLADYDVAVSSSATTRVMRITVTGGDPEKAAGVANELVGQLQTVAKRVMDIEAVNVISPAYAPQSPSGPNRVLNTLVAFVIGLLIALALVLLREGLDNTIRSDEMVTELLGVPVIGRIPRVKMGE